jgi:hypothetical protein
MHPYIYEVLTLAVSGSLLLLWLIYRWVIGARRESQPPPPPVSFANFPPAKRVHRTKTGTVLTLLEDQPPHSQIVSKLRLVA